MMKYVAVLFWAAALGQVAGFIGSALTHTTYNPMQTLIVSLIFGVIVAFLPPILDSSSPKQTLKSKKD